MLLVGGENLIDLVQAGDRDGCISYQAVVGGSPLNVAVAAGRQRVATHYLTPVSTDRFGELIAATLSESGVTLACPRSEAPSSLAVVNTGSGAPSYSFYRTGTADRQVTLAGLQACTPAGASIFHTGSLALAEGEDAAVWEEFACRCKGDGIKVSIDPNVRPAAASDVPGYRQRLERMLGLADIVKLSDEDLDWLLAGRRLPPAPLPFAAGAAVVIVTRGSRGASVLHDGVWHEVPAAPVAALKDTVGAGDTFMGSVLAWICGQRQEGRLHDLELPEKLAMAGHACRAAAIACGRTGCNPPFAGELE